MFWFWCYQVACWMVNTYFGLYFPLFFMSLAPLRQRWLGLEGWLEDGHKKGHQNQIKLAFLEVWTWNLLHLFRISSCQKGRSPEIQQFFSRFMPGTKISARLLVIPWFFSEKHLQTLDQSLDEADVSAKAPGLTRQSSIYKDMSPWAPNSSKKSNQMKKSTICGEEGDMKE